MGSSKFRIASGTPQRYAISRVARRYNSEGKTPACQRAVLSAEDTTTELEP